MKKMHAIIIASSATIRLMKRVNSALAAVCGGLVFLYMFLVAGNITGRYIFNRPVSGTLEIGQLVLASVIFFSLGYTQMLDAHIRVTVVLKSLPQRWQERFQAAILATGFLMMIIMAWRALPFAVESFRIREVPMSVDVPVWPTKFIFFIGWSLLGFQFFLEFVDRIFLKPNLESRQDQREKA
jgi:TRAP-type C4-dicarboxylate transport system permease small subunit